MIRQADKRFSPKDIEERIRGYWAKNHTYDKTKEKMAGREKYYFLDGPPYASGAIHLGTAWNKILKDSFLRYFVMQGYDVRRQPGWDCHGLPIEVMVEKKHNLKNKQEIVELGIEKFISECREWALKHIGIMTEQFKALGVWMDWDDPYMTLKDDYIEAAWWTIQKAYEKDLLVEDLRVVTWCPRCETALAEAEIEYQDRSDPSIYVKFPVTGAEDEYIVIWTTTPWTLIGNLAVMVHPDYEYVKARTPGGTYILASERAQVLKDELGIDYEVIASFKGSTLEGMRYRNPLSEHIDVKPQKNAYQVILADFVSLEEGTGCVHCAPGHGPEDFEAARPYGILPVSPVDESGRFTKEAGKYAGFKVKKDDKTIIQDLRDMGALVEEKRISHRYGHCWRCKSPIIYRSTEQWFIKVTTLKRRMLEEIEKAEWIPDWAGSARFKDWIENSRDWTISRQRYWGIPLPVWTCDACQKVEVLGSKKELVGRAGEVKELHKPYVDEAVWACGCGGVMRRAPDVLDVWFDSGVGAWASLGYPSREKEFDDWYPPRLIAEGHDQTRGWFYSLLGCGLIAFDSIPYEKVLMHGFTLDEKGNKMSKSLGNVVAPEDVVDKYGADILRFYVLWANKHWDDLKFSWDEMDVVSRMFNILWNVYVFATTYMSIDAFNPETFTGDYEKEDRWILSRLNTVTKEVDESFSSLQIFRATRALQEFILEDLSRWYVPLIRPRTWIEKEAPEKLSAYHALWTVLKTLSLTMAPITPHFSEEVYQNIAAPFTGCGSVHLESWVEWNESSIDKRLESQMGVLRRFVEAVSSAREKRSVKRRWPVKNIIYMPRGEGGSAIKELMEIARAQANSKGISIVKSIDKSAASDTERYEHASFEDGDIYIDLERSEDVIREGLAREVVRRIQQMRKDLDLEVESFIEVNLEVEDPEYSKLIVESKDYISHETRAKTLYINKEHKPFRKSWDIGGKKLLISIGKQG